MMEISILNRPFWDNSKDTVEGISGSRTCTAGWCEAMNKYSIHGMNFIYDYNHRWTDYQIMRDNVDYFSILDISSMDFSNCRSFHALAIPDWIKTARARNRFAPGIPMTVMHHTMSYPITWLELLPIAIGNILHPNDSLICISESSKLAFDNMFNIISERYGNNINRPTMKVIPYGIDTERFFIKDKIMCRKILNLPIDNPIILSFGRLSLDDKADLMPLLQAFTIVKNEIPKVKLVIAGEDSFNYSEILMEVANALDIAEDIIFEKNVPAELLPLLYAASDVFVVLSDNIQESLGIVLFEAMAAGCPVIAADWDGFNGSIESGVTGFLVPTFGPKEHTKLKDIEGISNRRTEQLVLSQATCIDIRILTRTIIDILNNSELSNSLKNEALKIVRKKYSWKAIIKEYDNHWDEQFQNRSAREHLIDLVSPDYIRVFKKNWSNLIDKHTFIRREKSINQLPAEFLFYYLPEMRKIVSDEEINLVLSYLEKNDSLTIDLLSKKLNINFSHISTIVLWLAKHGYVSLNEV